MSEYYVQWTKGQYLLAAISWMAMGVAIAVIAWSLTR